ncbi:substrate-binding domain-containing protein [Curtobacterium sp. 24E2]|nr:substrate-binding domain-containing protein [Curtobacterium sp. 24E2]
MADRTEEETPVVRIVAAAVVLTAALALAGCQGTTSAAPTPVQSTDLTSSDGGFDKQAVIGVVLVDGDAALGEDLRTGLSGAGFRPDVRVAPASGAAASQRTAVAQLVRKGAKALLVHAARPSALTGVIQTAHDAGVVVVSLGDPLPASGTGATACPPTTGCQQAPTTRTCRPPPSRWCGRCSAARSRRPSRATATRPTRSEPSRAAPPGRSALRQQAARLSATGPVSAAPAGGSAQLHQAGNDSVIVSTSAFRDRRGPASHASIAPTKPCAT